MKKFIFLILLIIGFFVACSPTDGLEQIATYPKEEPIAIYPRNPETMVVYNATLDLEVANVEYASKKAKEIAFEQHGYLVSSQSWYQDGDKHTTIVLSVPAMQFEATRDRLLRLGPLVGEWISSELVSNGFDNKEIYSQITVYLHPSDSILADLSLPQWRPVRTFEKAWDVFVSIFGFLLDVVIWVAVVAGPFVLVGWGIKKLIDRRPKIFFGP